MGIRFRITVVLLAMINLAIITSGYFIYQRTGAVLGSATERNVKDLLESEKKAVELRLQQEILLPAYLTRDEHVLALLADPDADEELLLAATSALETYRSTRPNLEGVFLVNGSGIIIADVNRSMIGISLSDRTYHQRTLLERRPIIGETVISKKTGKQIFLLTNPILQPETGKVLGYINVAVPSESMAGSLDAVKLNHSDASYACLVDENGNYIYHPILENIGMPVEMKKIAQTVESIHRNEAVQTDLFTHQVGREQMIVAFSVIEEANWVLYATGNMNATMAEVRALSLQVVLFDLLVILAASILSFFFAKRISAPVITALTQNNEELNALYSEVAASEEELHDQLDQIQRSRALLEISESKYRTLLDNSEDIIYSCECDKTIMAVNEAFRLYHGLTDSPIGTSMLDMLKDDVVRMKWQEAFEEALHGRGKHEIEYSECMNGTTRFFTELFSPIEDTNRSVLGITATKRDMTVRIEHEMKIMDLAYHDRLTHLPNRVLFYDELQKAVARCEKDHTRLAVALFDVDNFKRINDTLGHSIGDELLVSIADRLGKIAGRRDVLSRLGGDEFALLLNNNQDQADLSDFMAVACAPFEEPFVLHDISLSVTFSVGIAIYPRNGSNAEELMKNADTAMYKAKESGRNNCLFFDDCMNQELVRKTDLERKLKNAIANRELSLQYQPQYRMPDHALIGYEALLRWNQTVLGPISPTEFIPIAEETGLILPIGEWVIQQACMTCRKMIDAGGEQIVMAINISPVQFKSPNLLRHIQEMAKQAGIRLDNLEMEITEGVFIENQDEALRLMTQMKALGLRIALDDFGTGYSAFSYLRNLPITRLKIDKSFIRDMAVMNQKELIECIIQLAHKLRIECLAEGVETIEQRLWLEYAQCDSVQGFYFNRPLQETAALALLELQAADPTRAGDRQ